MVSRLNFDNVFVVCQKLLTICKDCVVLEYLSSASTMAQWANVSTFGRYCTRYFGINFRSCLDVIYMCHIRQEKFVIMYYMYYTICTILFMYYLYGHIAYRPYRFHVYCGKNLETFCCLLSLIVYLYLNSVVHASMAYIEYKPPSWPKLASNLNSFSIHLCQGFMVR